MQAYFALPKDGCIVSSSAAKAAASAAQQSAKTRSPPAAGGAMRQAGTTAVGRARDGVGASGRGVWGAAAQQRAARRTPMGKGGKVTRDAGGVGRAATGFKAQSVALSSWRSGGTGGGWEGGRNSGVLPLFGALARRELAGPRPSVLLRTVTAQLTPQVCVSGRGGASDASMGDEVDWSRAGCWAVSGTSFASCPGLVVVAGRRGVLALRPCPPALSRVSRAASALPQLGHARTSGGTGCAQDETDGGVGDVGDVGDVQDGQEEADDNVGVDHGACYRKIWLDDTRSSLSCVSVSRRGLVGSNGRGKHAGGRPPDASLCAPDASLCAGEHGAAGALVALASIGGGPKPLHSLLRGLNPCIPKGPKGLGLKAS